MFEPAAVDLSCAHSGADADRLLSQFDAGTAAAVAKLMGPVLVLGAGGKIGLHLCLMLRGAARAAGRELPVIAVSRFRTLREQGTFRDAGVQTIAADLSSAGELDRLPKAPEVFFLAGVKFGTASSPELLEMMNVKMPRLVAERYARSHIVAFSTGCVYPFVTVASRGASEDAAPAPVGAYAASCLQRERAFEEISRREGTKVTLLRLNYAVEFRYGVLVDIAMKVLQGEPIDVSMGHVNVIWQRDAVSQSIQSIALASSPPTAINITGAEVLSVREIAERFGRIFARAPKIVGVESATAWLSDASRSHRLFGPPGHGVETMIQAVATWLKQGGATWRKPTGFEKRSGKF